MTFHVKILDILFQGVKMNKDDIIFYASCMVLNLGSTVTYYMVSVNIL